MRMIDVLIAILEVVLVAVQIVKGECTLIALIGVRVGVRVAILGASEIAILVADLAMIFVSIHVRYRTCAPGTVLIPSPVDRWAWIFCPPC